MLEPRIAALTAANPKRGRTTAPARDGCTTPCSLQSPPRLVGSTNRLPGWRRVRILPQNDHAHAA
eukprot:13225650-Heterocapsa_arctica.AAC.1